MNSPVRIVITGVGQGLGRALVDEFARRGCVVMGCSRSSSKIAELRRRFPAPHDFQAVDVADDAGVQAWAELLRGNGGPPDLLINNAALINRNAPLWRVPAAEFAAIVAVNLNGVASVIRHFLPGMVARRRGVIVNLSSGWGRSVAAEVAPYCATKWGIEGLTRALALELPAGMAAVPLNPGIIDTEMLRGCLGDAAAAYPAPAEWARRAAPFLLRLGPADNGQPLTVP